ncbi:MAG TPA: hypothetical protein VFO01_14675 [Trebonia sp.]|nr:hypothetical protein [Trebonia sp.]
MPGRPIRLGGEPVGIGIAPDGKTAYVACLGTPRDPGTVVPISTATNKAGTPIEIPVGPLAMVIVTERGERRDATSGGYAAGWRVTGSTGGALNRANWRRG